MAGKHAADVTESPDVPFLGYACLCCAMKAANDEECDHESHEDNLAEFGREPGETIVVEPEPAGILSFRCAGCGDDCLEDAFQVFVIPA